MKIKNFEESKELNDINSPVVYQIGNQLNSFLNKINIKIFLFIFLLGLNDIIMIIFFSSNKKVYKHIKHNVKLNKEDKEDKVYNNYVNINPSENSQQQFLKEIDRPYLKEINMKRTFEKRLLF